MNKKLLIAVLGVAFIAAPMLAAQAGVTVYGQAQVELSNEKVDEDLQSSSSACGTSVPPFGKVKNLMDSWGLNTCKWNYGTNKDSDDNSATTVEDNARGRMGIKATEDLGGGLKAIAKFEWKVDTTQGGRDSGNREAYVGLQGDWGTFQAGTVKSPYKYYGGVKYDPFVGTNLEARRNGGMLGGNFGSNGFLSNSVSYQSPKKKSPFQMWVAYSPDEKGSSDAGAGASPDSGDYVIGVKFGQKNWETFVATLKNKDNANNGDYDWSATKVGGKIKIGPHTIVAQYEDAEQKYDPLFGWERDDVKILFLGYHLKMGGNNTMVFQYADGEDKWDGGKAEWTYYTAGMIHKFSKKTRIFGGYTATDVDDNGTDLGKRTALSAGLRVDF